MRRAIEVVPRGAWPLRRKVGVATLDFDNRHRRRIALATDDGAAFLLDLPEARVMNAGDGLVLETGDVIEVAAAPEKVCDVEAESAAALARLAWHLGNRHLPAQIDAGCILIRDDHEIVDMLKGLGADVRAVKAPFDPEGGAYGQHNHDLAHPHGHVHDKRHG